MRPTPIPMQSEKEHQSIRLFQNDLLERLSHVHPITPLLMWGPIAGWLLWRSVSLYGLPTLPLIGITLAGAFIWTLSEYCLHHFPMRNKLAKYLKHYHLKHHYSGEGGRYGVSSPVWDWGFGTDPGRN